VSGQRSAVSYFNKSAEATSQFLKTLKAETVILLRQATPKVFASRRRDLPPFDYGTASKKTEIRRSCASGLCLWSAFHATHTSKVATILSRWNSHCPLENIAHRIDIPKAALSSDRFHAVLAFFQSPASCFDAQAFDKLGGCGLHLFSEDSGEIARTHR